MHVLFTDGAASNKQRQSAKDTAKLDRETEELRRKSCTEGLITRHHGCMALCR